MIQKTLSTLQSRNKTGDIISNLTSSAKNRLGGILGMPTFKIFEVGKISSFKKPAELLRMTRLASSGT